jgi:hypothetical protein
MRLLISAAMLLALLPLAAQDLSAANSSEPSSDREDRGETAEGITDTKAFLEDIDNAIRVARSEESDRFSRREFSRLESARDKIYFLLKGHTSTTELMPKERIEFFNAQEVIFNLLGEENDDDRMVCKRVATLGTRVSKTVCMTEGERAYRARLARENTDKFQNPNCVPGETSRCGK